jgi:antitoxin (DNA-binding transcriptional repressor) of toxin-antitoxin stability system
MLEFRRNSKDVLSAIQRGESLILTYRGKPIARLEPILESPPPIPPDDPLLNIDDWAVDGPGGDLTNEEMDRIIYGY